MVWCALAWAAAALTPWAVGARFIAPRARRRSATTHTQQTLVGAAPRSAARDPVRQSHELEESEQPSDEPDPESLAGLQSDGSCQAPANTDTSGTESLAAGRR
jgi:hypothetical protein